VIRSFGNNETERLWRREWLHRGLRHHSAQARLSIGVPPRRINSCLEGAELRWASRRT